MFNQIGGLNAIGAPMSPHQIGGENFIRHIGNDKLIFDFHEGSGTTVRDKSREGNDGTFGAGAAAPTWKRNSLYFDGNDYIDLAQNFLAKSDFINGGSVMFIHKVPALSGKQFLFSIEGAWFLVFNADGKVVFDIDGSSTAPSSISSSEYDDNNYYCTIVTWDKETSATVRNIIDGVEDGSSTQNLYNIDALNRISVIGDQYNHGGWSLIGSLKMVRILSKCLSGIEAQQIFLSQKWKGNG